MPSEMAFNAATMRSQFLNKLLDPRRDIDDECGYPKVVTADQYRLLYDREGIAERVVNVYPFESWALDPEIFETEDADHTEFEMVWHDLNDDYHCYAYLQRVDELSGIGHYGLLLLGLDDGAELSDPVDGLDEAGQQVGSPQHGLLYLRVFDESLVDIASYETDPHNPRFGYPTAYNITFHDPNLQESGAVATQDQTTKRVHWHRVLHVADNRKSSEVFGVPRMRPVYNRLYDLRKLLGGSAEMFWKGAFPGYSFEVSPEMGEVEIDSEALRTEFDSYSNGLQRYLALTGVQAKSLAPQVADPGNHIDAQLQAIAITLGVPMRIFMGSEQAQLASGQDARAWNRRVDRRREKYLTPMLIRPYIDRLIALGVLPEPAEYTVRFPDLAAPTDEDRAGIALRRTEAFAKYVGGGVDTLVPPMEYLTIVCGMRDEEAEAIMEAAYDHILSANPGADPKLIVPPREPSGAAPPAAAPAAVELEPQEEPAPPVDNAATLLGGLLDNHGDKSGKNYPHGGGAGGGGGGHGDTEDSWIMDYEEINQNARAGTQTSDTSSMDAMISDAPTVGTDTTLYRGMELDSTNVAHQNVLDNLQKGNSFTDHGFVSTTTDKAVAARFSTGGGHSDRRVLFEITPQAGTKAAHIDSGLSERVLGRRTSFKVEGVTKRKGITHVKVRITTGDWNQYTADSAPSYRKR